MTQLTILGAGAWGTSLASIFAPKFEKTSIWAHVQEDADAINKEKGNSKYLNGVHLSDVHATTLLSEAVMHADVIISAVPSFAIRQSWTHMIPFLPSNSVFINASKGIEEESHKLPNEIFKELFGERNYFVLSGPSFAEDTARKNPTAVNLAGSDEELGQKTLRLLQTETFFLKYNNDVIGTELGAVLKNVIAIASGMVLGMGYGANTQAMIIVEGISEMSHLGLAMGAQKETFYGLAGVGDLLLSAMHKQSRNMSLGYYLGEGNSVSESLKKLSGIAEGYYSLHSLAFLISKYQLTSPLFQMLIHVLIDNKPMEAEVATLFKKLYE